MKKKIELFTIVKIIIILIAVLMVVIPFSYLFLNSIKLEKDFRSSPPRIFPSEITFEYYKEAFNSDSNLSKFFLNSLVTTLVSVVISVSFGSFAAYGFSKLKKIYSYIMIITYIILVVRFYPKVSLVIPYFILMKNLFLIDTTFAVIIAHVSIELPFVIWLMIGFYEDIPKEMEESAMLDGCGYWKRFIAIVFPVTLPGVATAAIMSAILSWNEFLIASSVTTMNATTLPIMISSFISDKGIDWGSMSAVGVIIVFPMFLFAMFAQRYLISGLTFGSVKG
jgi:multiple sugar transport system permease protein